MRQLAQRSAAIAFTSTSGAGLLRLSSSRTPTWSTPDLCDDHVSSAKANACEVRIVPGNFYFRDFGLHKAFCGPIVTVQCFEDNSKVKDLCGTPGEGRVLVVDGEGSMRKALLGDQIAAKAAKNGWAGLLINGCVRDVEALAETPLGIKALGAVPLKTEKLGRGVADVEVAFASTIFRPKEWVYCDGTGIIVASRDLRAR